MTAFRGTALIPSLALLLALGGCAEESYNIQPSYVSPNTYSGYTCKQLAQESLSVQTALNTASDRQNDTATGDQTAVTAAVVLFAPAAFFISPHDNRDEIGRLKGQQDAIIEARTQKKCNERETKARTKAFGSSSKAWLGGCRQTATEINCDH